MAEQETKSPYPVVSNHMLLADAAAEAGNYSEAYAYYTTVLENDPRNADAWFGKAVTAGWGMDLQRDRYPELLKGIDRALSLSSNKAALSKRATEAIDKITSAYFELSQDHAIEFINVDGAWEEHMHRCQEMLKALEAGQKLDPANKQLLRTGLTLTKTLLDGAEFHNKYEDYELQRKYPLPELESYATAVRMKFVNALQKLEPDYQPEEVAEGESAFAMVIGILVVLVIAGASALWFAWKLLGR